MFVVICVPNVKARDIIKITRKSVQEWRLKTQHITFRLADDRAKQNQQDAAPHLFHTH